jgi:hypothetical protein
MPEAAKATSCPDLVFPKCGLNQEPKKINGTDGCFKVICGEAEGITSWKINVQLLI